jgi:hypothetical protein
MYVAMPTMSERAFTDICLAGKASSPSSCFLALPQHGCVSVRVHRRTKTRCALLNARIASKYQVWLNSNRKVRPSSVQILAAVQHDKPMWHATSTNLLLSLTRKAVRKLNSESTRVRQVQTAQTLQNETNIGHKW